MKIYIEDTSKINLNEIENFKIENIKFNYIFSNEGIFKYTKNELYQMNIVDGDIKRYKYNNIWLISDTSQIKIKDKSYQIPIKHKIENILADYYELRPKALVKLVIEREENIIKHVYFLINADNQNIKEDIDTFLSLLKIY